MPERKQVVADARQDGIDLKIVVIGKDPPVETPLRDIATGSVTPTRGQRCWC